MNINFNQRLAALVHDIEGDQPPPLDHYRYEVSTSPDGKTCVTLYGPEGHESNALTWYQRLGVEWVFPDMWRYVVEDELVKISAAKQVPDYDQYSVDEIWVMVESNRLAPSLDPADFDYDWRGDTNEYPFDTVYFVDVDAIIDNLENEFLNDDYQPYINPLDYETALEFPCDHCGSTKMTARGFQKGRKGHNGEWTYRCFSICRNCGDVFEF